MTVSMPLAASMTTNSPSGKTTAASPPRGSPIASVRRWSGETERSLGYIHLTPAKRVKTNEITIRLKGAGKDEDAFGGIVEVAEPAAGELDLFKAKNGGDTKNELRIVEIEFMNHY